MDSRTLHGKWVWSFLEFVSVVPLVIRRMYLPLMLGQTIVAERYVIDTIVYNRFYLGSKFNAYARILLHMIPKGSFLIHLDASKNDVMSRRTDDMVSEKFISFQLESYRDFADRMHALSINTSNEGIDEASRRILNSVFINA